MPGVLTAQENYNRDWDLTCPNHGITVGPGSVCHVCRFPEDDVHTIARRMWEVNYRGKEVRSA